MSVQSEDRRVAFDHPESVIMAPTVLVTILQVLAIALIVGGLVRGGTILQSSPRSAEPAVEAMLEALGWVVGTCSGAAVLWSLGWLIRRQYSDAVARQRIRRALEGAARHDAAHSPAALRPADSGELELVDSDDRSQLLQRLVSEVMEMNANLLMSPEQRQAKGQRRQEKFARDVLRVFETALADHEFARAEVCIGQFEGELPDDARLEEMASRLGETRAAAEAYDVESHTRHAEDLMAVASFDEAKAVAEALLSAYPSAREARELVERVQREAVTFFRDQRQRLYGEVQRSADARRWGQALDAARRLVEAHPGSAEADSAAVMLTTLQDNARIEEVRKLRDGLRDMIKRQRYGEAVAIAQDLVDRFPDSHAANDLRGQMARLRELAAEEGR